MYHNDSHTHSIGTVRIQGDYKASIRLLNLNRVTAFICRIGYPIMRGFVVPLKSLTSDLGCSGKACICRVNKRASIPSNIELCKECIKKVYQKIQEFINESPEEVVRLHV